MSTVIIPPGSRDHHILKMCSISHLQAPQPSKMSTFPARSCSVLLIIFFIKLGSDGVSSMETYQAGEMGPDVEQTPLDKLEEDVISDLKTELDELEMEASSLYNMQKKYQELDSQGQCTNKHQSCIAWSCRDECHKNPAYMRRQCTWSCGACGPQHSCVDKKKDCDYWMKRGECYKNPASCMACSKGSCKDRHHHCSYWACIGECQRNPRYMLINCRDSCNVCHKDNNKPVVAGQNCPQPQIKVPQPTCNEKVDIIVLMDGSASVMARNFPDVRNFVLSLAGGFTMPAAQMGVYQYAHNVQREIGLNQFKTREDLLEGI
ncbi:COL6A3 [Branchiostoma lanceolatum]|uniref:COL6A3 protein n=2 Tax=Branchiostoma lanceolatum TaxID=7740 RepID=A0A8J9ZXQ9_BRALA|nr:COL6A3 [Branchiostoma lanceolatum]